MPIYLCIRGGYVKERVLLVIPGMRRAQEGREKYTHVNALTGKTTAVNANSERGSLVCSLADCREEFEKSGAENEVGRLERR